MLRITAHRAVVALDTLAREFLHEPRKRHTETKLLRQNMRHQRRRQQTTRHDFFRQGGRHEPRRLSIGRHLVRDAHHHDTDRTSLATAKLVALLKSNALGDSLKRRVFNHDTHLGHVFLGKLAAARRRLAVRKFLRALTAALAIPHSVRDGRGGAKRIAEFIELRFCLCKLELELLSVDAFGLRQKNATAK